MVTQSKLRSIEIANGELVSDHYLAMDPGTVIEKIEGIETKEPVFGLPAVWVSEDEKKMLSTMGTQLLIHQQLWPLHLTEILKVNMYELLEEELNNILEKLKETNEKLVSDLIPDVLPLSTILKVCQNLLKKMFPSEICDQFLKV